MRRSTYVTWAETFIYSLPIIGFLAFFSLVSYLIISYASRS